MNPDGYASFNTEGENASPKVSVIIATFNREYLIGETIESILNQSFADFELIVVSDGSTDNTEALVYSINDPRIKFLKQPNSGRPACPRNYGIREARGKYVAFCDDDDIWLPNKLEKQLFFFAEKGVSCVATNYFPIGDVRIVKKSLVIAPGEEFKDFSYEEVLLMLNPVVTSSVLARRDFLCAVYGFDESPDFSFIEDWELWLRLSVKGKIRILAESLIKYRMYKKIARDTRQVTLSTLKIIDKHEALGLMDAKTAHTARANCSLVIGTAFLDANDLTGIKYLIRGLLYSSTNLYRLKSLLGIVLFLIPRKLACYITESCYSIMKWQRRNR